MLNSRSKQQELKLISELIDDVAEIGDYGYEQLADKLDIDAKRLLVSDDDPSRVDLKVDLSKLLWFLCFLAEMPEVAMDDIAIKQVKITIIHKAMKLLDVSVLTDEEQELNSIQEEYRVATKDGRVH